MRGHERGDAGYWRTGPRGGNGKIEGTSCIDNTVSLTLSIVTGNDDSSDNHWSPWQGWKMSEGE